MPTTTHSSHSQLPDWLRNYAQEAAIAARNLGVNVTPPPQGSPQGTLPTVGINPYPRYSGRRFADVNPMEQQAEKLSLQENPLIAALEKAKNTSRLAGNSVIGTFSGRNAQNQRVQINNLKPYNDAYQALVTNRVSEATSAPNINRDFEQYFSGPMGISRHMLSGANAINIGHAEDIRNLLAESKDRGRALNSQAFNQDQARLLEAALGEAERGNLLNLARQNDIANLYQVGGYRRTLDERPMQVAEEEFIREQRHPYEVLRFLIGALNGAPVETSIHESINRPDAPQPSRSLHSSDYAGIAAQAAPGAVGALRQAQQQRQEQAAQSNAPAQQQQAPALSAEQYARLRESILPRIVSGAASSEEISKYQRQHEVQQQAEQQERLRAVQQQQNQQQIRKVLEDIAHLRTVQPYKSGDFYKMTYPGGGHDYFRTIGANGDEYPLPARATESEVKQAIASNLERLILKARQLGYSGPLE